MDDNVRLTVGAILVEFGILDPLVGLLFVGPRIPDETRRRVVTLALVASGAVSIVLGLLLLIGSLGAP